MAGQYLFDKCRTGSRQADYEYRIFRCAAMIRPRRKKVGAEALDLACGVHDVYFYVVPMTPGADRVALLVVLKGPAELFAVFKCLAERKRKMSLIVGIAGVRLKPFAHLSRCLRRQIQKS